MADSSGMPSGFDYEFVMELDDEYACPICHLAMRMPVLTKCGHRFCKECLEEANKSRQNCPLDQEELGPQHVFEDKATERKILSLKVKCPNKGCEWQGELRSAKSHVDECPLTIIPCSYGTFGCDFKDQRKSLIEHVIVTHLAFTVEKLTELLQENEHLKKEIQKVNRDYADIAAQLSSMNTMAQEGNRLRQRLSYTWKVNDFGQQLQNAKNQNRHVRLYCDPFCTHKNGYRLIIELHPNGNGEGLGTHVSVYLIIMRGEYDAILTWPFPHKIKFMLLDQKPDQAQRKNVDFTCISHTGNQDFFKRPSNDYNSGIGCPCFISHEDLTKESYVIDGKIFLRLELKQAS
ncbi:TNF receptor-associated factor 4 [Exaiptasia diaphana]|uniref:TNF receptor-associated factor n=1 Tax=Exaiptasia diaphana TaxID=2652724 RepID=A0A913Y6Y0_EXADI|nr:TNF receptor-associated factor 4 [Exaiptasia diaphana]KXJ22003.1 TNF receptor-associated factor 4 [Exaiptasia diaphana]